MTDSAPGLRMLEMGQTYNVHIEAAGCQVSFRGAPTAILIESDGSLGGVRFSDVPHVEGGVVLWMSQDAEVVRFEAVA